MKWNKGPLSVCTKSSAASAERAWADDFLNKRFSPHRSENFPSEKRGVHQSMRWSPITDTIGKKARVKKTSKFRVRNRTSYAIHQRFCANKIKLLHFSLALCRRALTWSMAVTFFEKSALGRTESLNHVRRHRKWLSLMFHTIAHVTEPTSTALRVCLLKKIKKIKACSQSSVSGRGSAR